MISGGDKFRSASQWTDTPLYRAMRDVMDSIVQGDYVVKKKFSYAGESIPSYTEIENIGVRNKGNPVAAAEEMRRHGWFKREYWLCLSKALGTEVEMIRKTGHTEFFFNAENMSSNYWSRPCELFARAFEAYIQDKLTAAGMMNNYLVADNLPTAEGKRMGLSKNYPQGAEREKINAKIDILVGEIRNALSKV